MSTVRMTLTSQGSKYPDIEVNRFPLVVGRDKPPFRDFDGAHAELRLLSREHAELTVSDEAVFIRDLGSRNGTLVNGLRISAITPLKDGDALEFRKSFRFTVSLPSAVRAAEDPGEKPGPEKKDPDSEPLRTFYLGADQFGLRTMRQVAHKMRASLVRAPSAAGDEAEPAGEQPWQESVSRLVDRVRGLPTRKTLIFLAVTLAAGIAAVCVIRDVSFSGRMKTRAQRAYRKGHYAEAVASIERFLADGTQDAAVATMWTDSQLRLQGPQWLEQWQAGERDALRSNIGQVLQRAEELKLGQPPVLVMLQWAVDAEDYLRPRLPEFRKTLFQDEINISELLERWDTLSCKMLSGQRFLQPGDRLETIEAAAVSRLRILEAEQSVYVKRVAELNEALGTALADGDVDKARAALEGYTSLGADGLDALNTDFEWWRTVAGMIGDGRKIAAFATLQGAAPRTPVFREVHGRISARLGSLENAGAELDLAGKEWAAGDIDRTIERLRALLVLVEDRDVRQKLARMEALKLEYDWLRANAGAAEFNQRLLALCARLDPAADRALWEAFEKAYAGVAGAQKEIARKKHEKGEALWTAYSREGGISLEMITNPEEAFEREARFLRGALTELLAAQAAYAQLPSENSSALSELLAVTQREINTQKAALDNMKLLISADLYDKRKALLSVEAGDPPQ